MIYWAMNERLPDGSWLLENNPLRGVKLPKEEDPRRPVATYDRFLKLREAAQIWRPRRANARRDQWKAWGCSCWRKRQGTHRAISGLRWSDIGSTREIRFRAEFDKQGGSLVTSEAGRGLQASRSSSPLLVTVAVRARQGRHWPGDPGRLYDRVGACQICRIRRAVASIRSGESGPPSKTWRSWTYGSRQVARRRRLKLLPVSDDGRARGMSTPVSSGMESQQTWRIRQRPVGTLDAG
jgi:hypothetical protein